MALVTQSRLIEPQAVSRGTGIDLTGVTRSFGSRSVLKGVDLSVAPGEFVSVLGPSGGGKTTLLRIVAGLESADGGTVKYHHPDGSGRSPVRVMFQEDRLLPWRRVIDNVLLGLPAADRNLGVEMLNRVGLQHWAGDWPHTLSGGQRQRVALARALAHQPNLLLLDEPFGALDALTRAEMRALLERLWTESGFTVLLVTHDVEEAICLSDRVCVLAGGRVVHEAGVDLPRPRRAASAAVAALRDQFERVLMGLGAKAVVSSI